MWVTDSKEWIQLRYSVDVVPRYGFILTGVFDLFVVVC